MTVLLQYLYLSTSVKDLEGPGLPLALPLKRDMAFEDFAKFTAVMLYNMPIMPALCSELAYYAGIMFDALTRLLCLKLCWHNQRRPSIYVYILDKFHYVFIYIAHIGTYLVI